MTHTTQDKSVAGKPHMRVELRCWSDLFCLWRLCGKPACRRARACHGDARSCFSREIHLLPEGVRAWFDGLAEMQTEGLPFDDAMEELDATAMRRRAARLVGRGVEIARRDQRGAGVLVGCEVTIGTQHLPASS